MLFHLTTRGEWDLARAAGEYRAPSLAREGFIHLSTEIQWRRTWQRFYRDVQDLVLLHIDPSRLVTEVRYEPADGDEFPHLYGVLPIAAVVAVTDVA
ncbi:MAG: DUF952 domain-containing protein [Kofleriaceae bacterium]